MKIRVQRYFFAVILMFTGILSTLADPPGPPPPGGDPVMDPGAAPVGGASIDDGIIVLIVMALMYASYKIFEMRKAKVKAAETGTDQ